MSYDLYYLFILPDWHGVDYVGEVDMEQEEQAPAVGVLKTRYVIGDTVWKAML